ncbi:hypothetical protein ILYODFUR_011237 [Ilyodon furcidens]|uniref:Sema domain-containing protein n=1 Tax=Ilyodon furcidens TaxID=33524 RepID=A0ABV0UF64_9TELE
MYVGSKDHILSLDLHDINKSPHIIHWPVSERRRTECLVSGKDASDECANFIRLIEPWNRTHLYVCGTGAYNPVCTFVNRGRKPQTSMYLQMAQARGRASRAAEPSAVHETFGLKVRCGPCLHCGPSRLPGLVVTSSMPPFFVSKHILSMPFLIKSHRSFTFVTFSMCLFLVCAQP